MKYQVKLEKQLFFFQSLLKDIKKEELFIKKHFNLTDSEYIEFTKKVLNLIYLQEEFIKQVKMEEKIQRNSVNKQHVFLQNHIKDLFFETYNAAQTLYDWYKPFHNEDNLFLCGMRNCFSIPLYWFEQLDVYFYKK